MEALPPAKARNLDGKVVLVTGGASGIGAGVVRDFVERGARVVIADIAEEAAAAVLVTTGSAAIFQRLDVGDEDQWVEAVKQVSAHHGRLDALVNCAGILLSEAILAFEKTMFDRVLRVNLTGTFLGIKHCAPLIAAAGGGAIVNISSTEGLQGANSMAAYASSKWGVRGLTKVAAFEFGAQGIRVNSVHPGPINTPMINPQGLAASDLTHLSMFSRMPIARVADVSEVAAMCAYLVSDESRFVTGAEFVIDGGMTAGNRVRQTPMPTAQVA